MTNIVKKRVLIIGLDGGTFDVLNPMIKKGLMPNLKRLIENGGHGILNSTIPPSTGPSWVSMMTGKNPGKHGVFDFLKSTNEGFGKRPVYSTDIACDTIWTLLSKHQKTVGVINVPITYPPSKVNGFMISGMLTPSVDSDFIYPHSLREELFGEVGDYLLDTAWTKYNRKTVDLLFDDINKVHEQRRKVVLHMMQRYDWDFFMVTFTETDRIQHSLWDYIQPTDIINISEQERRIREKVEQFYHTLDQTIGQILESVPDGTITFVVSDHGFGRLQRKVYMNKWLSDLGFLTVNRKKLLFYKTAFLSKAIFRAIATISDPFRLRKKLPRLNPSRSDRRKIMHRYTMFFNAVNWNKTKAYISSMTEQSGIFINLKKGGPSGIFTNDREYEEVRETIIDRLKVFKDPETGKPVATTVLKKEDVYSGPYLEKAPDILFILNNCQYRSEITLNNKLFETPQKGYGCGNHRIEGILIVNGEPIKKGYRCRAEIVDIFPTVLFILGVPLPKEVDGKVLEEIFEDTYLESQSIRTAETMEEPVTNEERFQENETEEVMERLKDLGYLT